jgi:hypothetical protein
MAFLVKFFFIVSFLAIIGIITYKVILPIGLKIIDFTFDSLCFRFAISIFLAIFFFVGGIMQLRAFLGELSINLSLFFPLSFFLTGICLYLGLQAKNCVK